MATETVCIPSEEYQILKKKEHIADNIIFQLEMSLQNMETGKIRRVR